MDYQQILELVKEVSKKAKVSQKATADILSATLETIQKTVSKGKKVTQYQFQTSVMDFCKVLRRIEYEGGKTKYNIKLLNNYKC